MNRHTFPNLMNPPSPRPSDAFESDQPMEAVTDAAPAVGPEGRSPIRIAAIVIPALLLGFAWFTAATWIHFSGDAGRGWLVLLVALAMGFVPTALAGFNVDHPLLRVVYRVTALVLGFLNFAFVAAIACWLALGLVRLTGLAVEPRTISSALYGAAILATVVGVINAAYVRVTRVTVELPGLPDIWNGR
jgi:hypothetical protein